jgi:hypothetical protein
MATTCELIAKHVLGSSAATLDLDNIPATYTDLLVLVSGRCDDATASYGLENVGIKFNNSTSNFTTRMIRNLDGTVSSSSWSSGFIGDAPNVNATANTFGSIEVYIPNYAGATNKSFSVTAITESNASVGSDMSHAVTAGLWSNTAAITRVGFTVGSDNWVSLSSFYLYGITKA